MSEGVRHSQRLAWVRDAVEAIDAVLARLGGYRWYSQRLDAGVEQDRERHVWVGVLEVVCK